MIDPETFRIAKAVCTVQDEADAFTLAAFLAITDDEALACTTITRLQVEGVLA